MPTVVLQVASLLKRFSLVPSSLGIGSGDVVYRGGAPGIRAISYFPRLEGGGLVPIVVLQVVNLMVRGLITGTVQGFVT